MNLHILAVAVLCLTGVYAVWSDVRRRRLPNILCLVVAVLGAAVTYYWGGLALTGSGLIHGLAALIVGMLLFSAGIVGGGDAKYYAATAVWFPLDKAGLLLLHVSVVGLVLILFWFFWRRLRGIKATKMAVTDADKFPYGVAIALGAFAMALSVQTH